MGVFMQYRVMRALVVAFGAWVLKPKVTISKILWTIAFVDVSCWAYFVIQALQVIDLMSLVWGILSKYIVVGQLDRQNFFCIDGASDDRALRREQGLSRLSDSWKKRWPKSRQASGLCNASMPDLRMKQSGFESIFHPMTSILNNALDMTNVVDKVDGTEMIDIDGERFLDVSGAHGVNVCGMTRCKQFLDEGNKVAQECGIILGHVHPLVLENVELLKRLYKKEEVTFHMSGTEAVMSAVGQVRFHTHRTLIVSIKANYHGWWDGVLQGPGMSMPEPNHVVLKDINPASLSWLQSRGEEIGAVLVSPISSFGWGKHNTRAALGDRMESASASMDRLRMKLQQLRKVCTQTGIVLIFDDMWSFHLGPGCAQEELGVLADIVTAGKSLGGGQAIGVVCGPSKLMGRQDPNRAMRLHIAYPTFGVSPVVHGSMNAVLKFVTSPEAPSLFESHKERVERWAGTCNAALKEANLPFSVWAYRCILMIEYHIATHYNAVFQYYLRDAGLYFVWVGTSKMNINMEFTDSDFERLTQILLKAGKACEADGWWFREGRCAKLTFGYILKPTLKQCCSRRKRSVQSS